MASEEGASNSGVPRNGRENEGEKAPPIPHPRIEMKPQGEAVASALEGADRTDHAEVVREAHAELAAHLGHDGAEMSGGVLAVPIRRGVPDDSGQGREVAAALSAGQLSQQTTERLLWYCHILATAVQPLGRAIQELEAYAVRLVPLHRGSEGSEVVRNAQAVLADRVVDRPRSLRRGSKAGPGAGDRNTG